MEGFGKFSINMAKSLLGKNVNLHLKDGSVIVNVLLAEIQKDEFGGKAFVKCSPYKRRNTLRILLKNIAWAELLNLDLILTS